MTELATMRRDLIGFTLDVMVVNYGYKKHIAIQWDESPNRRQGNEVQTRYKTPCGQYRFSAVSRPILDVTCKSCWRGLRSTAQRLAQEHAFSVMDDDWQEMLTNYLHDEGHPMWWVPVASTLGGNYE